MKELDFFKLAKDNGKLSHLYLLTGDSLLGLKRKTEEILTLLFGDTLSFVNKRIIEPSKDIIKRAEIDDLLSEFDTYSLISGPRVFVIVGVEYMNKVGVNSLLRFLEEPKEDMYGFLLTANFDAVLDTIVSRAQVLKVNKDSYDDIVQEINKTETDTKYIEVLSNISSNIEEAVITSKNPVFQAAYDFFLITLKGIIENESIMFMKNDRGYYFDKERYNYYLKMMITFLLDVFDYQSGGDIKLTTLSEEIRSFSGLKKEKIVKYCEMTKELLTRVNLPINYDLAISSYLLHIGEKI